MTNLRTIDGMRTAGDGDRTHDLPHLSRAAATYNSTGVDTTNYREVVFLISTAALAATSTLAVKLQESETVGGTYTDITGAAKSYVDADDDKLDAIYVNTENVDRKKFVRANCVVAVAAAVFGIISMRLNPTSGIITAGANVVAVN
jgi:hypothetical protein